MITKLVIFAAIAATIIAWIVWEAKHAIIEDDTEEDNTEKQKKQ